MCWKKRGTRPYQIWNNLMEEHTQKIETSAILGEALHRGRAGWGRRLLKWLFSSLPRATLFLESFLMDGWKWGCKSGFFLERDELHEFKSCEKGKLDVNHFTHLINVFQLPNGESLNFLSFFPPRFYLFLEREEGKGKEGQKHQSPKPRTQSTTQACALTRNQTSDPSLCETTLNQLSHASQG